MVDLLVHLLRNVGSDDVLSRGLAFMGIAYVVWRGLVRSITQILTTTAVLGISTLLLCHPLHR